MQDKDNCRLQRSICTIGKLQQLPLGYRISSRSSSGSGSSSSSRSIAAKLVTGGRPRTVSCLGLTNIQIKCKGQQDHWIGIAVPTLNQHPYHVANGEGPQGHWVGERPRFQPASVSATVTPKALGVIDGGPYKPTDPVAQRT